MTSSEPEPEPDVMILAYTIAIIILIILSAFFSATETAYSSLNRARLKVKAQDGGKNASLALKLSEKFDDVLFTLLIGNNIVNITASTVATLLFVAIIGGGVGPAVSTIVLTITVLIFGEIFPKLIAKNAPERFAITVAPILKFFMVVLFPLCIIFKGLKKLFTKVFKLRSEESITDEELKTIVEEASEDGVIEEGESELIHNAIDFHDCEVGDILVPRVNVEAVEVSMPMKKIKNVFKNSGYSRLPVYDGTIDKIIGMIHEKDFTVAFDRGDGNIKNIIKKMAIATEHMRISTLLKSMQKARVHMANVVDEYGGTLGIVTLEDILEELVGEIWDEHDEIIDYFEKTGDGKYLVDGNANLEDFFELFDISLDKYNFDSQTVSGWVIEQIGDLPKKNANFEFENLKIIVTRCSQKMVYEIKVLVKDASSEEEQ